jgi:hypothetical protein
LRLLFLRRLDQPNFPRPIQQVLDGGG